MAERKGATPRAEADADDELFELERIDGEKANGMMGRGEYRFEMKDGKVKVTRAALDAFLEGGAGLRPTAASEGKIAKTIEAESKVYELGYLPRDEDEATVAVQSEETTVPPVATREEIVRREVKADAGNPA